LKSLILRGISDELYKELKSKSAKDSKSINKILLSILENNFGLSGKSLKIKKRFTDLDGLFGRWNRKDYEKMSAVVSSQRKIDEEIWK